MKYAIKLPEPMDTSLPGAAERMENAMNTLTSENRAGVNLQSKASSQIKRTIVGVMFHPYWKNVALVLQEGGNVHAIDVSNGMIVNEYVAMVQQNSSWAIDPATYRMMVVGDSGKAIMFDARMGAKDKPKSSKSRGLFSYEPKVKKQVHTKRVPVYAPAVKEQWPVHKNWFTAHTIKKNEPCYVNNVKFCKSGSFFISTTNFGEVKLWDNSSVHPLATLNSNSYDKHMILRYIEDQKKTRQLINKASISVNMALNNQERMLVTHKKLDAHAFGR